MDASRLLSSEKERLVFLHSLIPPEPPIADIDQNTAHQPSCRVAKCDRNDRIENV